jgi:hypothetical protein
MSCSPKINPMNTHIKENIIALHSPEVDHIQRDIKTQILK